ncbi:hypothetical protein BCR32DRAFT_329361 [Anaeromyces robustus]|uniref:Uncharacterized protein n=1 Tax=Anaeromyces robustus TaxID=1754192 RepID=A0A1Y1WSD3_9FUNG|nr:hypothetical protein BCR32DRAFT_329361 [Anaeromyces robustus]|eukprot:ORX76451.1 hypothetical protein BCR32DRAFT_329361 [Anaeromyces robustus]
MVRNFYNSNENSNVFVRGFRCYGTDINNTSIIFINGLHSWTNVYMMDFLESKLKEFNKYILSVKRSMCSRGWYFRIKVLSSDFIFDDFKKKFVSHISNARLSYSNCTHYIRKRSLQQIRNQLFSPPTNFNDSINNQSNSTTNLNFGITFYNMYCSKSNPEYEFVRVVNGQNSSFLFCDHINRKAYEIDSYFSNYYIYLNNINTSSFPYTTKGKGSILLKFDEYSIVSIITHNKG